MPVENKQKIKEYGKQHRKNMSANPTIQNKSNNALKKSKTMG